jgi:hypothetical protein
MRVAKRFMMVGVLAASLLGSATAWAGELVVGAEPLEVDGSGKLTKAGREKAVTKIESSVPGDEVWSLFLWAKIDNPAVGPLYLEFYRNYQGKQLMAHRVEFAEYAGDKFVSMDVEISRSEGFRAGETVDVAFVQNVGGRDVKKAKGKLELLASSKPAPKPEKEAAGEEEEEEEKDPNEAREIASDPAGDPSSEPPPVESGDKKGCTVGGSAPPLSWALLGLVALRRRRGSGGQARGPA